jgi:hypothetical protein
MKFRCEPPSSGAGAVIHPVVIEEGQLDPVGTHKDPPFCFGFLSFLLPHFFPKHKAVTAKNFILPNHASILLLHLLDRLIDAGGS